MTAPETTNEHAVQATLTEAERLLKAGDVNGARSQLWPIRDLRSPSRLAVQTARLLLGARLHREAESLLDEVLPNVPAGPLRLEALDLQFTLKDMLGRPTQALSALDEAIALDPKNVGRYDRAIHALEMSQGYDDAIRAWKLALSRRPSDAGLLLRGGDLHRKAGQGDESRRHFLNALAVGPDLPSLRMQAAKGLVAVGALKEAWQQTDLVLAREPKNVDAWLLRTRISLWRGQIANARESIATGLELAPESTDFIRERAACNVLEGHLEAALPDLDSVLERNRSDSEAHFWRAEALFRLGRDEEALREASLGAENCPFDHFIGLTLRHLIKLHLGPTFVGTKVTHPSSVPDPVEPLFNAPLAPLAPDSDLTPLFALVHEESADAKAIPERRRRLGLIVQLFRRFNGNRSPNLVLVETVEGREQPRWFPHPSDARSLSRDAVQALPISGEEKARALLDHVQRTWPDSEYPWTYGGEIDLWLGHYASAGDRFREALKKHRMVRWGYIGLSAVAMLEGRYEDAVAHGDEGVRISGAPGPTYWIYRAEALRRLGRIPQALETTRKACEVNPTRNSAWMNLALLQVATNDHAGLQHTMERLERQAPGILVDAAKEAGVSLWNAPDGYAPERVTVVLDQALHMMRGNRSSARVTYFTADGVMHWLPILRY